MTSMIDDVDSLTFIERLSLQEEAGVSNSRAVEEFLRVKGEVHLAEVLTDMML